MLYDEAFCGSCAVLYAKRSSQAEVVGDQDGGFINFSTTVKLRVLVRTLCLLPNSRALFAGGVDSKPGSADSAWPLTPVSSILRAARFAICRIRRSGGDYAKIGRCASLPSQLECSTWQECLEK